MVTISIPPVSPLYAVIHLCYCLFVLLAGSKVQSCPAQHWPSTAVYYKKERSYLVWSGGFKLKLLSRMVHIIVNILLQVSHIFTAISIYLVKRIQKFIIQIIKIRKAETVGWFHHWYFAVPYFATYLCLYMPVELSLFIFRTITN